jgi:hypothetical protein
MLTQLGIREKCLEEETIDPVGEEPQGRLHEYRRSIEAISAELRVELQSPG